MLIFQEKFTSNESEQNQVSTNIINQFINDAFKKS